MITLSINKKNYNVDVDPDTPLLWVLRDHLNLVGTKYGCGVAQCGACVVHLNGEAVRSFVIIGRRAAGWNFVTIVGLSERGVHHFKKPGWNWMWCNADIARPDKLCRRLCCCGKTNRQLMQTLMQQWQATFAVAEPMSAFGKQLNWQLRCHRGESESE